MNIIFYRYGNICEEDIISSFEKTGLVVVQEKSEINNKYIDSETRIEILAKLILEKKPLFVFSINFFPYISSICERLNVLYICWSVDCPVLELYSQEIKNKNNRVFLFDYEQFLSVSEFNKDCIFYLPLATNVNRWDEILNSDTGMNTREKYDVSFVGSLYSEYSFFSKFKLSQYNQGFCDGLMMAQKDIEGLGLCEVSLPTERANDILAEVMEKDAVFVEKHSVQDLLIEQNKYIVINQILGMEMSAMERINILYGLSSFSNVHIFTGSDTSVLPKAILHGKISTHTQMPIVFNKSKINLNITMRGIQTGLSQRIWDVLGCRGFLITDYQSEISQYFTDGVELVCYENAIHCGELVDYYLKHDEEREEIAMNGYKKVAQMHTYDHRIAAMLKVVFG